MFANVEIAMQNHRSSFSETGIPVIFKNVVPLRLLASGLFIYIPQNAWAWHGPASTIREFFRRNMLRICSEFARMRASRIVRIGPMIPDSENCVDGFLPNTLDQSFETAFDESEKNPAVSWVGSKPYFIAPGSYWSYRNLEFLIEAYIDYHRSSDNPKNLVLVGPAAQARYFNKIKTLGENCEGIIVIGKKVPRAELLAAVAGSALCVFPSLVEASPVTVLEAASLGATIVAWDNPAHRYIEKHLAGGKLHYFTHHEELKMYFTEQPDKTESELENRVFRTQQREKWANSFVSKCLDCGV